MNLISQIARLFGSSYHFRSASQSSMNTQSQPSPISDEELLVRVQKLCTRLPEGKAQVIMGNGTLSVCVNWKPAEHKDFAPKEPTMSFWLNGENENVEYCELVEEEATPPFPTSSSSTSPTSSGICNHKWLKDFNQLIINILFVYFIIFRIFMM